MEPVATAPAAIRPEFARRFEVRARATGGVLAFADFMELALYDAETGYYRAARTRVGTGTGTDFQTAATLDAVFGKLIVAAATALLEGAGRRAEEFSFIEIGAEPGRGVLDGVAHPFGEARVIRVGEPPVIPPHAVVFSNELFDAQPFHRLTWRGGAWREQGVRLVEAGAGAHLAWTELEAFSPEIHAVFATLPAAAREGYTLDLPLRARALIDQIARANWNGLFLACDYGRTWHHLTTEMPQGSGRAYWQHHLVDDLLARPGEQDITCHVCWDWLEEGLRAAGFASGTRESQEAFFIRRAESAVRDIVAREPNPLGRARSQLKQLIHPGLMGQKFDVLFALR